MPGYYSDPASYYQQRNQNFSNQMMNVLNTMMQIKQMRQQQENWQQGQQLKERELASLEGSRKETSNYYKKMADIRQKESEQPDKLPATAALMEYMVKHNIAKDPADAWNRINETRVNQGLTAGQKEMQYWRKRGVEYDSLNEVLSRYDNTIRTLEHAMASGYKIDYSNDIDNLDLVRGDLANIRLALDRQDELTPEQRETLRRANQIERVRKEGYYWKGKESAPSGESVSTESMEIPNEMMPSHKATAAKDSFGYVIGEERTNPQGEIGVYIGNGKWRIKSKKK